MRITVNESPIGELFFSLPQPEELIIAEEQIINHCRNALQQKENSRLEYELEQMQKTKTAFHFLILKEIYSLSKENGHSIILTGNIAGSIISYLLGISPINPDEVPFIAPELIWEANKEFSLPCFEMGICADARPLIHERLDEKFGFINTNDTLYYRIVMADYPICNEASNTDINIKNFDTNICTAVLKELYPEQENNSCNFEQLINCYAYLVGSFANEIPLEDLLNDNVIVTRDKLYLSLTANNVPHELAAEIVKKGIWSGETRKREYILQLEKYSLPESVIFSINNAKNLWNTAEYVSRLCLRCHKEYELIGKKEDKYDINDSVNNEYIVGN